VSSARLAVFETADSEILRFKTTATSDSSASQKIAFGENFIAAITDALPSIQTARHDD
jgi:hypothetical protein